MRRAWIAVIPVLGWAWALAPESAAPQRASSQRDGTAFHPTVAAPSRSSAAPAQRSSDGPRVADARAAVDRGAFIASLLAQPIQAAQPQAPTEPRVASQQVVVVENEGHPSEGLAVRFAGERSDPDWTRELEEALSHSIAASGARADRLSVDCRTTLCRVGVHADDLSEGQRLLETASRPDQRVTVARMQAEGDRTAFEVFVDRPQSPQERDGLISIRQGDSP